MKHSLTYNHLWNHAKDDSTAGLCISEFIDNSISNYLKNNENGIAGCVIDIHIDETDPNNLKLHILDNCYGMDEFKLDEAAIEYHNQEEKSSDELNQHGVGMKFAIFWFGKNGKIWTKKENEQAFFLDYDGNNKKGGDEVSTKSIPIGGVIISRGTKITIENIYNDNNCKRKLTNKIIDELFTFIQYRFIEYFKMGLIINIFKSNKDSPDKELKYSIKKEEVNELDIFDNKSFTLSRYSGIDDIGNISSSQQKELDSLKEHAYKFLEQIDIKQNKEIKVDYSKLISNIKNNFPLIVDESIIINNYELPVKICFLTKPSSSCCGVAIKHSERYIYHLPNMKQDRLILGTMPMSDDDRFHDGIYKWMYATVDLTNKKYGIKPDKNKAKMMWSGLLPEWYEGFEKIIIKYSDFINLFLKKIQNIKKNNNMLSESIKKVLNKNPNSEFKNWCDNSYNTSDTNISKEYNIEGIKVDLKPDLNLNVPFSCNQISEKKFEFKYNPASHIFHEQKSCYILKLVSLLQIIWNGSLPTDNNIINVINNILREE